MDVSHIVCCGPQWIYFDEALLIKKHSFMQVGSDE